jgi:alpha-aminoadipate/glutamate carrier protein LysW
MSVTTTTECPVCGGGIDVAADTLLGELLDCVDCGSELEVRGLTPTVELREAPVAAEDWGE